MLRSVTRYVKPLRFKTRKTRKLDTDKFAISLINKCGHFERKCDEMVYLGVRKSDNSTISLMGKTLHDSAGKIIRLNVQEWRDRLYRDVCTCEIGCQQRQPCFSRTIRPMA